MNLNPYSSGKLDPRSDSAVGSKLTAGVIALLVFGSICVGSVLGFIACLILGVSLRSGLTQDRSIELPVPSISETAPILVVPEELVVNVLKDGRFRMNGKYMSLDEVEESLRAAKVNNPLTQTVAVSADRQAPFEQVVNVVNICLKTDSPHRLATSEEELQ